MNGDNESVVKLCALAHDFGKDVSKVCLSVLHDPRFWFSSGSARPWQHHFGSGGLSDHTLEVVELCLSQRSFFLSKYKIDRVELFLAALFHDVGKMYDYELSNKVHSHNSGELTDLSKSHKRMIHHISRSGIIWSENASKVPVIYDKYFEKVLHAILAHHTCRAAGSPVAPKSRVAWLVTLCDNISARMYDADTLDIIKHHG